MLLINRMAARSAVACLVLCSTVWMTQVWAGLFDDELARGQIAAQQKRLETVNQRLEESNQRIESLATRLLKTEDELKSQQILALVTELEKVRAELRDLRGQSEVLANSIEGVAKRQRDMYIDLDQRLIRIEQAAVTAVASPPTPPITAATSDATKVPPVVPNAAEENDLYERAQGLRKIGNYKEAILSFESFINRFPKSALAPRAQYWIGDSQFNLRDFKAAMTSQQKLISLYPESVSVSDAMLNIASIQMELGDSAAARKTMENLVARYPNAEATEKARRRLANPR
jgi:tol-pal system protein YbgF